jgi:UDP-N-acetyl-D-mannosaminuronic acid transferase (WecB/TagA/CpsF family)
MNGNKANILGVALNSTPKNQLLREIVDLASVSGQITHSVIVFTPNPEFLVEAQEDSGGWFRTGFGG